MDYSGLLKDRLEWGKLATFVPNKDTPVYNWFYYKEGFARELVLKCLESFGVKKGMVLDPFCGSGTTCVAAKKLGRRYIGIEDNEKYCRIARNRVANTEKPLFPAGVLK